MYLCFGGFCPCQEIKYFIMNMEICKSIFSLENVIEVKHDSDFFVAVMCFEVTGI